MQFLVSFPSFDDLDRVDGIQVGVPSFSSSICISAWRYAEVPHKVELEKVWLHVEGVPHTLRHFLGLWAVGSLVGKTVDVDLMSLRWRAVVRIQVAMLQAGVLGDPSDEARPIAKEDAVVKFKAFEFRFRRNPADYVPEPDFVPLIWVKKVMQMRVVMGLLMPGMMLWTLLSLDWGHPVPGLRRFSRQALVLRRQGQLTLWPLLLLSRLSILIRRLQMGSRW
jgi:hypothetical protein